jgi:hypothetical protein
MCKNRCPNRCVSWPRVYDEIIVQLQGMGAFVSNDVNPADEPGQKKTMIFAKHMPPWFAEAIATPNDPKLILRRRFCS